MFHRTIEIDLTSTVVKPAGTVLRLLRELFGRPLPQERANTAATLTAAETCLRALDSAGFHDVISASVGSSLVYVDDEQRSDDLEAAITALAQCDTLNRGSPIQLALSREHDGLHTVVTVTLRDAMTIRWSSRITAFRIAKGERPGPYKRRIREALLSGAFDNHLACAHTASDDLVAGLGTAFGPTHITASEMLARVVLPGPTQLGRLRHVGFGEQVRERTYHAVPTVRRRGPYDDPHVHHFFDPYHDLLCWLLARAVAEGLWHPANVEFVDINGSPLQDGQSPKATLRVPADAVVFLEDRLEIAEDIPDAGFDIAEAGSPNAPGWGGENFE